MYKLPDLNYEYSALEPFIDEATMRIHHTKHHQGYIDKLNKALEGHENLMNLTIEELMMKLDEIPEEIKQVVINNGGGHINHSMFWEILRASKENNKPEGEIEKAINQKFGNFEEFKKLFNEKAMSLFGSGWVFLELTTNGLNVKRHSFQNNPLMYGNKPIMGIDVWEHAYYLKYQNRRAEYVDAWWNVVNWEKVEERYLEASK